MDHNFNTENLEDNPAIARILVVEDEYFVRSLIATVLRDLGVIVIETANADEAWKYLASGLPIDLVFTDYRMPGSMNGADLAARIRAEHPDKEVVITSGNWQELGWLGPVIPKPYSLDDTAAELIRRVRSKSKRG